MSATAKKRRKPRPAQDPPSETEVEETPEPDAKAPPKPKLTRLQQLHPKRFFLETWQAMDREAAEERAARKRDGKGYDYRPLVVLCAGAVFLTLMEYFGMSRTYVGFVERLSDGDNFWAQLSDSQYWRLSQYGWWAGCRVLGYFVLPALTLKAMGQNIDEYGLETKGFSEHAWIYAFSYGIVFICVVCVSFTEEFSTYYPFYKLARRSWLDFASWEVLYAAQFFSLEFFFRGFWLKACKSMMGSHAIFAMVVPYCMIHFNKPFVECLAAIFAGIVLGTLSMKTRSIWSGFLIHVSVAITMDSAALLQTVGLPDRMTP